MRKKTLIQILLFFLLILLSFYIFFKYFNESNLINEKSDKNLLQSSEDKNINNKKDLLKNVKYTSNNVQGDIFELKADFGESNSDKITSDDRVNVILTDILPAYSGVLYSVNGTDTTKLDSGFFAPSDENPFAIL